MGKEGLEEKETMSCSSFSFLLYHQFELSGGLTGKEHDKKEYDGGKGIG